MAIIARVYFVLLGLIGLGLALAGLWLASLGGSFYYLILGLAYA